MRARSWGQLMLVVGMGLISAKSEAAPITRGYAVVALDGATDAAAPLARAVYGHASLRPYAGLDESRAHVLLGETAPSNLQDLASTRAAVHGDDAPSVKLLSSIAADFRLRGIVVVSCEAGAAPATSTWGSSSAATAPATPACVPVARMFLDAAPAKPAHFETETFRPDVALEAGKPITWNASVAALDSEYGVVDAPKPAPLAATSAAPRDEKKKSHAFYESAWFWGALGAAAFAGTAIFLATRDNGGDTIHLQMQVPQQ